jgi:hypothetical protein
MRATTHRSILYAPPGPRLSRALRVVIGGGGVAALETALALRALAGERVALTLVSPGADFVLAPLAVGAPFAVAHPPRWSLAAIAHELGARHVAAAITRVEAGAHRVRLTDGSALEYDALVLALGAHRYAPFPQAHTFFAEDAPALLGDLVGDLELAWSKSVAFVVPPTVAWTLPAYELALLTAREVRAMGIDDARIAIVTPEQRPLALFGVRAATVAAALLDAAAITIETGANAALVSHGAISLRPGNRRLRSSASWRCRSSRAAASTACRTMPPASSRSTRTRACAGCRTCSPPATAPTSPSSREASPPNRQTRRPSRSRCAPAPGWSPTRSGPCCAAGC